jgi:hypothetical protein
MISRWVRVERAVVQVELGAVETLVSVVSVEEEGRVVHVSCCLRLRS